MAVTQPVDEAIVDLRDEDLIARFDALQAKLPALWSSIGHMNAKEQTIVVVPAMSIDNDDLDGPMMQAYEERFLFLLLLLRQPSAHVIYVTSQAIHPGIVDYYLDLLPGVIPSHARRRLHLVSPLDGSGLTLTQKLLARPRLLQQMRSLVRDPDQAHLVPYNTTELERELAVELGIPMYGADPRHFHFGTKTGCRRLFVDEGVAHPAGSEDLHTIDDLLDALLLLRSMRPALGTAVVKLNEGVSGSGNASVDLRGLPAAGAADERDALLGRVQSMQFEDPLATYDVYMDRFDKKGGIVEERIAGTEVRSPSVQLRITPLGVLEVLSTHDQLLGGPTGQAYLGCVFPADPAYATAITREAVKVGRRLAKEGVIGRFALDFLAVQRADGTWDVNAIEINLRKGGTTHPFLTLQFLTDGKYDGETGVFTAPSGRAKYFVASDHLESESFRGLTPDDLFDVVVRRGLHFDQSRQTGVVFHMMSALSNRGRVGLTAVGDSPEEAQAIYETAEVVLLEEAAPAWRD
jgi:hypothetical protein